MDGIGMITRFGLHVYMMKMVSWKDINIFGARILVRRDKDEKLYLYDIVRTKETKQAALAYAVR